MVLSNAVEFVEQRYTARDGTSLYARHYPAVGSARRPVVCLPGLTRNSRDFHALACTLSNPRGHRRAVFALDYRGRGQSERAADPKSYTVLTELNDVLDFMTLAGIHDAAIIGSSRGGILAMLMGAIRPTAIGAVVLNDIGPVIERDGLARLVAYVGRVPVPQDWPEAAKLVRGMNARAFPKISDAQWETLARQWFEERGGRPAPGYDPALSQSISFDAKLPLLWPQFMSLARVPMLVVRGANSDILSPRTVEEMARRHPNLETLTIADQGHAPLLNDDASIAAIYDFLVRTDRQPSVGVTDLHALAS